MYTVSFLGVCVRVESPKTIPVPVVDSLCPSLDPAEVVFVDGAHHIEVVVEELECGDPVAHMGSPFKLLVHHIVTVHPSIRRVVIRVVHFLFL